MAEKGRFPTLIKNLRVLVATPWVGVGRLSGLLLQLRYSSAPSGPFIASALGMWASFLHLARELKGHIAEHRGYLDIAGRHRVLIEKLVLDQADRMSPFDPVLVLTFTELGFAFIHLGRFDEAVAAAKNAIRRNQTYAPAHRCLAAALTLLGRDAEARMAVNQALEIEPDFRVSKMIARHLRNPIVIDAPRKAALPE